MRPRIDLPSPKSVDLLVQSILLVIRTRLSDESEVRLLLIRCAVLFVYAVWHTKACPVEKPLASARQLATDVDRALAIRILQRHGVTHRGLGCVNAVVSWIDTQDFAAQPLPPPLPGVTELQQRRCCCCREAGPWRLSSFSPVLWRVRRLEAPICDNCVFNLERRIPLYPQPEPRWCSACGRAGGGEALSDRGAGCFVCAECAPLLVGHG